MSKRAGGSVLRATSVSCALALLAACSSSGESVGNSAELLGSGHHGHGMHMKSNGATPAAAPSAHLTYYGGPVISSVKIITVFWGSAATTYQSQLGQFFSTVTASSYFDWLSEYDTPTQNIGRGTFAGTVVDATPPAGTTIDDSQIQTELSSLIDQGKLPANDGNTLYMVYFPPGLTITMGGSQSCQAFCAYHGTFAKGAGDAYYGVMPDLGGACASGCGDNASQFDNLTEVSSHEMIEAVTDSAVGLATGPIGAPLAWYDQTNGEIGDICVSQGGAVAGFAVQLEWSNANGACIAASPGAGNDAGSGDAGAVDSGPADSGAADTGPADTGLADTGPADTGGGTCAHAICATGSVLTSSCDPCAAEVCAQDSFCCATKWDATCVSEVGSICGQTCH